MGPVRLAEVAHVDGHVTKYSVTGQSVRFPKGNKDLIGAILVAKSTTVDLPYVGVHVGSVDAKKAKKLGVAPWKGVSISKVEPDSAASMAELQPGDILLAVDDVLLASKAQFIEHAKGVLAPGDQVELTVSREGDDGERGELKIPFVVGARSVDETESDRVNLPMDSALVGRTGLGVVTVPADLAGVIYGRSGTAALISAVVTGSPAYLSGLRAGDRILRANDSDVRTVADLRALVDQGAERLKLTVDGGLGSHTATVRVEDDVLEESDFHIPIIVDYESRPSRSDLTVLEFIFQFGFDKSTDYLTSRTRKPRKTTSLSILPLGMFEFKRTPTRSTNRIFWFIEWSSKR